MENGPVQGHGLLTESAYEREFLKFLPLYQFSHFDLQNRPNAPKSGIVTLTALAQLGALRLNASRALISFVNSEHQYVLAESTQTLPLRNDYIAEHADDLWFGSTILPAQYSTCSVLIAEKLIELENAPRQPVRPLVVPDLTEDPRFRGSQFCKDFPDARFYAGVPIVSPRGAMVGCYCVFDDKPRHDVPDVQLAFLQDSAVTVMDYLVRARLNEDYRQGESMMRGIGSFVEARSTLRTYRMQTGHDEKSFEPSRVGLGGEGQLNKQQQNIANQQLPISHQESDDAELSQGSSRTYKSSKASDSDSRITRFDTVNPTSADRPRFDTRSYTSQLKELPGAEGIPTVAQTFSRAANLIRESLEVEGALFLDATVNSYGGLVEGRKDSEISSAEDLSGREQDGISNDAASQQPCCAVIAYSTSESSSINDDPMPSHFGKLPERTLRSLLKRHRLGRIFNFDLDGNLSSDASSSSGEENNGLWIKGYLPNARKRSPNAADSNKRDAILLKNLFPKARSIGLIPLWDSSKSRWYAGGFIWTNTPVRSFTVEGHLSFLNIFASSIMAEITRINIMESDQAKSDILGSISHELRSPLHGILGTVELLQEANLETHEIELVEAIQTCGRTLLDSVDHLLDYTKLDNLKLRQRRNSQDRRIPTKRPRNPKIADGANKAVRLDIVTEEVLIAILAGYVAHGRARDRLTEEGGTMQNKDTPKGDNDIYYLRDERQVKQATKPMETGPLVIINISKAMSTAFITSPGAWRRIVMNLVTNAFKYTEKGSVTISLDLKEPEAQQRSRQSRIILTVTDTGRGMSKAFIDNKLFTPFSQEDTLSPGTGLGLSIVKRLISLQGGRISVESRVAAGTSITVTIPMYGSEEGGGSPYRIADQQIQECAEEAQSMTLSVMLGETRQSLFRGTPELVDKSEEALRLSVGTMCQTWFNLVPCSETDSQPDVRVIIETSSREIDSEWINNIFDKDDCYGSRRPILIVLCSSRKSLLHFQTTTAPGILNKFVVDGTTQPCGIQRFAKVLSRCLKQRHEKPQELQGPEQEPKALGQVKDDGQMPSAEHFQMAEDIVKTPRLSMEVAPIRSPEAPTAMSPTDVSPIQDRRLNNTQTLILPFRIDELQTPSRSSSSSRDRLTPRAESSYLLVDDNALNLKILTAYFKKKGKGYATASDGQESLDKYTADPLAFDVILMDISMPVMDGLQATRAIRLYEKQHSIRPSQILILTGLVAEETQREAYASGADAFMTKPVRFKELDALLYGDPDNILS